MKALTLSEMWDNSLSLATYMISIFGGFFLVIATFLLLVIVVMSLAELITLVIRRVFK